MISMMSWDYAINPGFVGLFSECQVVGLLIVLVSNIINEALLGFLLRFSYFLVVVLDWYVPLGIQIVGPYSSKMVSGNISVFGDGH